MAFGALRPLLGCSWRVLASLLLVLSACLACLTLLPVVSCRFGNDLSRHEAPNSRSPPSKIWVLQLENQHFLEHQVFHVYLPPDVSGTPSCYHLASPRCSWSTSRTLLSSCQASFKCLSLLLGRFSAALDSLWRLSCLFFSLSALPDSPSHNFLPIWSRFWRLEPSNSRSAPSKRFVLQ